MSARPHSVQPRPPCAEADVYANRNNFLLLLLGLIANAERLLEAVPGLAPGPPQPAPPASPPPVRTILR